MVRTAVIGYLRWFASVVVIGLALTGLLALVAHVAHRRTWNASHEARLRSLPRIPHPDTAALFAAVDAYLLREKDAVRAPGMALVVVRGDRVVHQRGFGTAAPNGRVVTSQTAFILGSLSKSFTAIAIMQLVDSGKIDLDAPVQRYLRWFRVRDATASRRITVRHLLHHTSGIPTSTGLLLKRASKAATEAQQASIMRGIRLGDEPGHSFIYSNANYWLLGLIVETVAHESYDSYVRRHIFAPLDMKNSFTSEDDARAHGMAQGYRVWFGYPRAEDLPYYSRELAVGYLISSPEDMGKYLIAHLNGARYRGAPILSPASLAALHTAQSGTPYAMGWLVDSIAGVPVLWHTGAVANYHAEMLLIPGERIGVAILANVNNFLLEGQLGATIKDVGAILLGYEPAPRSMIRYKETYWIITLAALLWLVWRTYQVATIRRWSAENKLDDEGLRSWRPHIAAVLLDPGMSLGLLFGVPNLLGSPLSTLTWYVPDLTDWLILNVAVSALIAISRVTLSRSYPRPRTDVSEQPLLSG